MVCIPPAGGYMSNSSLPEAACLGPPSPFGLWRGSLRSLRYEGLPGLAQPKLAKRAKAGGARRDRTADLLHAMQALSQLSYGPLSLPVGMILGDHPGRQALGDSRGAPFFTDQG